jgi:hypothetical protein
MRNDLPGWKTIIDEISNGVFKVTLVDNDGRKAEVIDIASNETIDKAVGFAFDIEKQVTKNWNKFLYDFCLLRFSVSTIVKQDYNDKAFGSWFIEFKNHRIVYDGRDFWLILQELCNDDWLDNEIIKKSEMTFQLLTKTLNKIK